MPDIRILIVDDHAILRDGIRSLLERQKGIKVVGEASNGREALEKISGYQPHLVLMDIAMPEMNGLEATREIRERYPHVNVLILTQHDNREYVTPLLQAGAAGYVLKKSGGRELISAIREVSEHGAYLESSVARTVLESLSHAGEQSLGQAPYLTDREKQVLQQVVSGKSNKEIAHLLNISPKTVSVHRSNIMTKLGVGNSVELIHYVNKHRIIEPAEKNLE